MNANIIFAAGTFGRSLKRVKAGLSPMQGIYKSTDGGRHWDFKKECVFLKQESCGSLFAIDSRSLELKDFVIYSGSYDQGLLVSRNSGTTWHTTSFIKKGIIDIKECSDDWGSMLIATESGLYRYSKSKTEKIGQGTA